MCFSHSARKRLHLIGSPLNVAFIDGGLLLLQMFDLCVRCRDGWRTPRLAPSEADSKVGSVTKLTFKMRQFLVCFPVFWLKKHVFTTGTFSSWDIDHFVSAPQKTDVWNTFLLQLSVRNLFQWVLHSLSAAVSYFNVSSLCCCCCCVRVSPWNRIV